MISASEDKMENGKIYDVFLSYSSTDRVLAEELATRLRDGGVSPFLDLWHLIPGEPWQEALEQALGQSQTCLVCLGPTGPGPWNREEVYVALDRAAREHSFRIIPVLLPGAEAFERYPLPVFLRQRTFVDLRRGFSDDVAFQRLLSSIRTSGTDTSIITGRRTSQELASREIQTSIRTLQDRFFRSIKYTLAGGDLIQRDETQKVLKLLDGGDSRIVVVHGVAGSGKSGVVYELALDLSKRNTPFIPLRLDRLELQGSPKQFGQKLGLLDSPAKCLSQIAQGQQAVLLLDQLDALRWTSAHSSEAWDVCRELISEALAISDEIRVIVCCRTFDLQHDPQFRGWEQEAQNLQRVEVGELSEQEVEGAVLRASESEGKPQILKPKEKKLLQHIQHLQMWLAIFASTREAPRFDTALALMDKFWANRRDELDRAGLSKSRTDQILDQLLRAMDDGARLSVPVRKLKATETEQEILQSLHLLQVDPDLRHVSFCHQSYLDYLVVRSLQTELDDKHRTVIEWLGEREHQSLFRREQLRLVLGALREEKSKAYIPTLRDLFSQANSIRFHLRQLGLQFLGQLSDLENDEVELVLELLNQPFWLEHILAEVVGGNVAWFEALDHKGKIAEWLGSNEEYLRNTALNTLRRVAKNAGESVARLLRPYLGSSKEWGWRVDWVLPLEPEEDSEALFEIRLQLANAGSYRGEHVNWSQLAQANPLRFFLLASSLLIALANSLTREGDREHFGRSRQIDWYRLDAADLLTTDHQIISFGWKSLALSIGLVAEAGRHDYEDPYTLESYAAGFETLKPVVRLLCKLGRELLRRDWRSFVNLGENLVQKDPRIQPLFLDSLASGPAVPEFSDWVLDWLFADPWRVRLRLEHYDNPWQLSGEVIERFTSFCSDKVYQGVESSLLDFIEPDFAERYRYRHEILQESLQHLNYPSFAGATPYHLLPKLPEQRRSDQARLRTLELQRKFREVDNVFFAGISRPEAGFVGSPISAHDIRNRLSDRAWLDIISSQKLREDRGRRPWSTSKPGYFEQSTIGSFSSDLRYAAEREPERFARLALRIPADAPQSFLNAIVSGLTKSSAPDGLAQEEKEHWQPVSHEALETILQLLRNRNAIGKDEVQPAQDICWIFRNHASHSWSPEAVALLVWIASQHQHPKPGYFPIGFAGKAGNSAENLETNALNVTRGVAGFALQSFLFAHKDRLEEVTPAIERLISDDHPSVRVAVIAACLPVLNIDRRQAIGWFLKASDTSDTVLATREVANFFRYTLHEETLELRRVVERMLASPQEEVKRAAARQVTAVQFFKGLLPDLYSACLNGVPSLRVGVAEVAAELLGEAQFAEPAKHALLSLANDDDHKVAEIVARSFRQLDLKLIQEDRQAWVTFARSKAFQVDPSHLLLALERQSGDLRPFADCLIAVGTIFGEELAEASRNISTGIAADVHYLVPLLLRLYEQTKDEHAIHQRCLDLWDRLLERRVGEAMNLTRELDRI